MCFVAIMSVVILVASFALGMSRNMSQWPRLEEDFVLGSLREPPALSSFNNVIVNGLQFNGTMRVAIHDGSLYLQPLFPLSLVMRLVMIPVAALELTSDIRNGLQLVKIRKNGSVIGLSSRWISQLEGARGRS